MKQANGIARVGDDSLPSSPTLSIGNGVSKYQTITTDDEEGKKITITLDYNRYETIFLLGSICKLVIMKHGRRVAEG